MRNNSDDIPSKLEPPQPSQAQIKQISGETGSNLDEKFDDFAKRNGARQESSNRADSAFEAFMTTTKKCLEKMEQILALSALMRKESEERLAYLQAREKEYVPFVPKARAKSRRRTTQRRTRRAR